MIMIHNHNSTSYFSSINWHVALIESPPDEYKNYLITFVRGDRTTRVTMDMWCPPIESREGHWFNHGDDVVRWRKMPEPYAFAKNE